MRVLIISDEVWNDQINGNNVLSNWFNGTDFEIANIYASSGMPYNHCCKKYFQITDYAMAKSIFTLKKAGNKLDFSLQTNVDSDIHLNESSKNDFVYSLLKPFKGNFLRLVREFIWLLGHYNTKKLYDFVDEFQPDIIFTERYATCKILRLEKIIFNHTKCPVVAFTGDDEYSLHQLSFSPSFWINRLMVRKMLRKNVKRYSIYYTLSEDQKKYYESEFGVPCDILRKCGKFTHPYAEKNINNPIVLVYAGKLYCKRWKALADIANVVKEINRDGNKIVLHIYTKDVLTKQQNRLLNDGVNSIVFKSVTAEELSDIYARADVALHVESNDLKNRLLTHYSFSTKIIDCMFSLCAVLAYCWSEHTGYRYLQSSASAICAADYFELKSEIKNMVQNTHIITEYQQKMFLFAEENHSEKNIHKKISDEFSRISGLDKR